MDLYQSLILASSNPPLTINSKLAIYNNLTQASNLLNLTSFGLLLIGKKVSFLL